MNATELLNKNSGLTVKIENDQLVISIGINTLAKAAILSSVINDAIDDEYVDELEAIIPDANILAKSVVYALEAEDEDGTTFVHKMFDEAFESIIENGEEGIVFPGDEDYKKYCEK